MEGLGLHRNILHVDEILQTVSVAVMKHILLRAAVQIAITAAVFRGGISPLIAATAIAPVYDKSRITDLEYGVFCDQGYTTREDAPDTSLGYIENINGSVVFKTHGLIVPAQIGFNFGVKSRAIGSADIDVLVKTTHPPFSSDGSTVGTWNGTIYQDEPTYKGFGFDFPYELALGDWTMKAYQNGKPLYSVTFTVVDPKTVPWLAQMCKGDALLS